MIRDLLSNERNTGDRVPSRSSAMPWPPPWLVQAELNQLSRDEFERYEERAAIMEFDGGLNREDAERLALDDIKGRRSNAHD